MVVEFNEKDHIYIIDGEVANTSVTKLLAKHKLANDYTGVDEATLKKKANYGTNVHKDIENIINEKDYTPTTDEGKLFKEYAKEKLHSCIAETMLGLEYKGLTVGGSVDLLGFDNAGNEIIADHKTYAQMTNKTLKHISWQLSFYNYMARKTKEVNGNPFAWFGAKTFIVLWYHKVDDKIVLEPIEVEKIEDSEIEELLECEVKGEIYKPKELNLGELELELQKAEMILAEKELELKQYKDNATKYRNMIKQKMEEQQILNWKSPNGIITISYVSGYVRNSIDSKKLQKERPDIYNSYLKPSNVSATIKVSVDEDKLNELKELESGSVSSLESKTTSVENE